MIERLRAWLAASAAGDAEEARVRAEGYPGRGTVVAAHETGRIKADRREMDVTLDVYVGRSRTFRVVIRPWVRAAEVERLRPGNAVPVAADHNEPGHVVLALDMDEPRSIAGLGPFAGGRGGPKPLEGVDPGSARTGRRPLIGVSPARDRIGQGTRAAPLTIYG